MRLSEAMDRLWTRHTDDLRIARARTAHDFAVWGQPARAELGQKLTTRERDAIFRNAIHPDQGPSTAYQRLRFVMDYWCALWFWPIEKAHLLPSRHEFLLEIGSVLEGTVRAAQSIRPTQGEMFNPEQARLTLGDEYGLVDVRDFCNGSERLTLVRETVGKYRFLHWELEFADVFADAGGFDLILGNPPWIKVEWNESAVMGDVQPLYAMRDVSAPQMATLRDAAMAKYSGLRGLYLAEYAEFEGTQAFLNAQQNYPLLMGSQSNTFKCFVTKAWDVASECGVQGFLHPEGVYDDPHGGALREALYHRLRFHFHFRNEKQLFAENDHHLAFSTNVYGGTRDVRFHHIANLFEPVTIDACFRHDGFGPVPGIKNDRNEWEVNGHLRRILDVDTVTLALFATLYDEPKTPALKARLPALHGRELVEVLRKFAAHPNQLGSLTGKYKPTDMFDETFAVKKDHTIRRETRFPAATRELVISGPHIYVGTPIFKTPRSVCLRNGDYDVLDFTQLPEDYLPRTNFVPDCPLSVYRNRTPSVPWHETNKVTDYYRVANREMLAQSGERTLISAILPPSVGHVHTVFEVAFRSVQELLRFAAGSVSLPFDFFVKTTGMGHANRFLLERLPLVAGSSALFARTLLLNCLTHHYADLWRECWDVAFIADHWAKLDTRLSHQAFSSLTPQWSLASAASNRLSTAPGPRGDRCPSRDGARSHSGRPLHHLPYPIPGPPPI